MGRERNWSGEGAGDKVKVKVREKEAEGVRKGGNEME